MMSIVIGAVIALGAALFVIHPLLGAAPSTPGAGDEPEDNGQTPIR